VTLTYLSAIGKVVMYFPTTPKLASQLDHFGGK